ncbi:MAG: TrmH family RNA methyltransferase [Thermodesulfobacteriota bacterium]
MAEITQRRKERIQEVLQKRQRDLTLIIDNIHDPHNVSAILRSCDAFGIYKIHLYYTTEEFPEMGRKSSASAMKWVEREKHNNPESIKKLKDKGYRLLATGDDQDSLALTDWDITQPVAVILGNEHRGISPELVPYIDGKLYIPMQGMVESLNVSVAAAVILYEGWRQRQAQGMYENPDFSSQELQELYNQWYKK